jgi:hypothetical protein
MMQKGTRHPEPGLFERAVRISIRPGRATKLKSAVTVLIPLDKGKNVL